MTIGIIDYGMGNLRSVQKAFERFGAEAVVLDSPEQCAGVSKLILPGVGAFADGMEHLRRGGWLDATRDFLARGLPYLGICLGMQLLFEGSQEDAPSADTPVSGMGILPGQVVRFRENRGGQQLKVPHMGWNAISWDRADPLFTGLDPKSAVYFVHSYYAVPTGGDANGPASARADYGGEFCASVWQDQIWATQFHPEKSQQVGLKILANFAALCGG